MRDERVPAFLEAVNSTDNFSKAVDCHRYLDEAASDVLSELLIANRKIELDRLSFVLKLDLVIALGAFPADFRPLAVKLNAIRNRFAHSRSASVSTVEARQLYQLIPVFARENLDKSRSDEAHYMLGRSLGLLYASLIGALERTRDNKVRESETLAIIDELIGPDEPEPSEMDRARVEAKVADAKAERNAQGKV